MSTRRHVDSPCTCDIAGEIVTNGLPRKTWQIGKTIQSRTRDGTSNNEISQHVKSNRWYCHCFFIYGAPLPGAEVFNIFLLSFTFRFVSLVFFSSFINFRDDDEIPSWLRFNLAYILSDWKSHATFAINPRESMVFLFLTIDTTLDLSNHNENSYLVLINEGLVGKRVPSDCTFIWIHGIFHRDLTNAITLFLFLYNYKIQYEKNIRVYIL